MEDKIGEVFCVELGGGDIEEGSERYIVEIKGE